MTRGAACSRLVVPMNPHGFAAGESLDPVAAYDRVAPVYARLAKQRGAYLDAIDRLVDWPKFRRAAVRCWMWAPGMAFAPGASPEPRAYGISFCWSRAVSCVATVPRRRTSGPCGPKISTASRAALTSSPVSGTSSGIFCLPPPRVEVLRQFARLVSPEGRIFIDLNHRYNARHYGALATVARFLRDRVSPGDSNGDVRVTWNIEGHRISTTGHVFTDREFSGLVSGRRSAHREAVRHRLCFGTNSGGGVLKAIFFTFCDGRRRRSGKLSQPRPRERLQRPSPHQSLVRHFAITVTCCRAIRGRGMPRPYSAQPAVVEAGHARPCMPRRARPPP